MSTALTPVSGYYLHPADSYPPTLMIRALEQLREDLIPSEEKYPEVIQVVESLLHWKRGPFTSSAIDILPPELLHRIFELGVEDEDDQYLQNRYKFLLAASLTCVKWLNIGLPMMYTEVVLWGPWKIPKFCFGTGIGRYPTKVLRMHYGKVDDVSFGDAIVGQSWGIHTLELSHNNRSSSLWGGPSGPYRWPYEMLCSWNLKDLTTLRLKGTYFRKDDKRVLEQLTPPFSLHTLHYSRGHSYPQPEDETEIFRLFGGQPLVECCMDESHYEEYGGFALNYEAFTTFLHSITSTLSKFTVTLPSVDITPNVLVPFCRMENLKHLNIGGNDQAIASLIQLIPSELISLTVGLSSMIGNVEEWRKVLEAPCLKSLKKLRLKDHRENFEERADGLGMEFLEIVEKMSCEVVFVGRW